VTSRWILAALALAACADGGPSVRVETAAGYAPPRGATVSVLGVFRDGRMSRDSWDPLSAKISAALGSDKDACKAGWGRAMREAEPDLAQWLDAQTRENGMTEEALARVAPRARGDLVMTLLTYRYMPPARHAPAQARPRAQFGGRRGYARGATRIAPEPEAHVFELSASFYSAREHKLVAEVNLRYEGDDLDEAMDAFATKLRALLPGARCAGWTWPEPAEDSTEATEPSPTPSESN